MKKIDIIPTHTFDVIISSNLNMFFRFAMELHMVHKSEEGHLAVIGVLFRKGEPNAFISRVINLLFAVDNGQELIRSCMFLSLSLLTIWTDNGKDQFDRKHPRWRGHHRKATSKRLRMGSYKILRI